MTQEPIAWGHPREGKTIHYEPWNKDDRNIPILPGERLRIRAKDGQSLVLDRKQIEAALAFLDWQKKAAE